MTVIACDFGGGRNIQVDNRQHREKVMKVYYEAAMTV